jgi:hypothetical protein
MTEYNRIYVICGNARTFVQCFDSAYSHIIDKLFDNNTKTNTHVLFYLKCDDPGPKGQKKWDFTYPPINKEELENQILHFTKKYNNITFHSKVLLTNEIGDDELFSQVKHRNLYNRFLSDDKKLLRALHCIYNLEKCGKIIKEIELKEQFQFDYYIYIRPDLFFKEPCKHFLNYTANKIINGIFSHYTATDHIAIVPKQYIYEYFFLRMDFFRTNTNLKIKNNEALLEIFTNYSVADNIGDYMIKRY